MNKTLKQILITTFAIIAALAIFVNLKPQSAAADSGQPNTIKKMNVSTGITVGTSSVDALDASSGRVYAVLVNDSANPIYISLNGAAAVVGQGIRLNATGGSYEINLSNQYIGQINAISGTGGSNLTVTASQ